VAARLGLPAVYPLEKGGAFKRGPQIPGDRSDGSCFTPGACRACRAGPKGESANRRFLSYWSGRPSTPATRSDVG